MKNFLHSLLGLRDILVRIESKLEMLLRRVEVLEKSAVTKAKTAVKTAVRKRAK